MTDRAPDEKLLCQMLGAGAQFRDGQWEAVDQVANQRRRALVVQRTGWGKSVVYFLATKILRDAGTGPTLLISPLLSLMRNQITMGERLGIRAFTIHSQNLEDWPAAEAALREKRCDVLLISPERLANQEFLQRLLPLMQGQIGLFVVDEAHCISDWGHDFRPDYRRIVRVLRSLPAGVPVLCTTATANDRVVADVLQQIPGSELVRGPLTRHSLKLFNIRLDDQAERLAWLAQTLPQLPGSGIVYCLTIADARRVAGWLQAQGIAARPYHSEMDDREQLEQALVGNELKALVATVALGMGFDKPDLGFVIHFQRPGSVVAYYQQVGRAGRAVDSAFGILLTGREDDAIVEYFIRTAFPPAETMQAVLRVLESSAGLTVDEIGAALNNRRGTVEKALKLLEVDNAVIREKTRYIRTPNVWTPDVMRAEEVTELRRAEVEQMRRYVEHTGCLMEFLRGDSLVIEPRKRWLAPVVTEVAKVMAAATSTAIPEELRSQEGRVLCQWGDAEWGGEVARGKYDAGQFSDALVEACVRLLREKWRSEPFPAWVTAVPSRRRPELVPAFAEKLAQNLGLPFVPKIHKTRETEPQKQMQNSVTQVRNLLGVFAVAGPTPPGAVLLVDDLVDSGWTLAVLAVLLRQHGSGPVYPLALAKTSPRGD